MHMHRHRHKAATAPIRNTTPKTMPEMAVPLENTNTHTHTVSHPVKCEEWQLSMSASIQTDCSNWCNSARRWVGVCQKVCGVFCEERRVNCLDVKLCTRLTKATFTCIFAWKRKVFLLCFLKKKLWRWCENDARWHRSTIKTETLKRTFLASSWGCLVER